MIQPDNRGYIKSSGVDIYYQIYGEGETTLMFLHGNEEDYRVFEKQIEYFANEYKVVTIDSRGHGKSTLRDQPLTIGHMADDVVMVIDQLKLKNVVLAGFSDGGNIAIEVGMKRQKEVCKLILIGANLNPGGIKKRSQYPVVLGYWVCKAVSVFHKESKKKCQILGLMVREPNFRPKDLEQIKIPVLVMAGEKDVIKKKHTILIAKSLPKGKMVFVPAGNHFVLGRNAAFVNKQIKKFIKIEN